MAPGNVLPIHGNEKTMNLNSLILTNIQSSPYFKNNLYELKTYHEVLDEIYYKVNHLEPWEKGSRKTAGQTGMCGGVRGVGAGGIVSSAFCLLYKLYTMRLTRKQLNGLINHTDSPYIRGVGFMYIRYTQPPADFWDWYSPYLDDEEEVDVKAGGGCVMTVGAMVRSMMTRLEWWSTLFPRIPVPVQKKVDACLKERAEEKLAAVKLDQQVHDHLQSAQAAQEPQKEQDYRQRERDSRPERPRDDRSERPRDDRSERPRDDRSERPRDERERSRDERERPRDERERPRDDRSERPRDDRSERPRDDRERRRSRSRSRDRLRRDRSRERRDPDRSRNKDSESDRRDKDRHRNHHRSHDDERRDRHSSSRKHKHHKRSRSKEKRSRSRERRERSRSKERRDRSRSKDRNKKRESSFERDLRRERERQVSK